MFTELRATHGVPLVRKTLHGPTMGSRWSAAFYAPVDLHIGPLHEALQEAVDVVDQQMSTWSPNSDLNCINRASVGSWVKIPPELTEVLEAGLAIGRASGGTFDIGVGDLVKAWGFGGGTYGAALACAARVLFDAPKNLQLDVPGRRARRLAQLSIDLSGIAKGFGVDELARVLSGFGVRSYLVGIDGELRVGAPGPDGRPWAVGHEKPSRECREIEGVLELRDVAVATSGNYRQVVEVNDQEVSHTMDPRIGQPLVNDLTAVTVLAPTCMVADAWATALMVAGYEAAASLARKLNFPVILVRSDGEVTSTI